MRAHGVRGLLARPWRVRATNSRHAVPVAPDLLGRRFTAAALSQAWLADLTHIPTGKGWLHMAAIMDLHTRKPDAERQSRANRQGDFAEIVGWSMRNHLRAELATAALMMAVQRQRPQPGLIQHSDRGIQHACTDHQDALSKAGIPRQSAQPIALASMSRRGNALDNAPMAPMESFFHTLKTELAHHQTYATHDEAKRDLLAFVEG